MGNQSYFKIDVFDYVDEEENVEEYGKRLYIDVSRLADDIKSQLEKIQTIKNTSLSFVV